MLPEKTRTKVYALFAGISGALYLNWPLFLGDRHLLHGDLGDTRFLILLTEHFHRFFSGAQPGFWTASWLYYPYPRGLAFSDLMVGALPLYSPFRAMGISPFDAFRALFLVSTFLNFLTAYALFRKLNCTAFGSSLGALIFSVSMPRAAQIRPQLMLEFYSTGALWCLAHYFTRERNPKAGLFVPAFFLLFAVQLYTAFYLAWFLGFFLLALLGVSLCLKTPRSILREKLREDSLAWVLSVAGFLFLIAPLYFFYKGASKEVGMRHWREIQWGLPNFYAYFQPYDGTLVYQWLLRLTRDHVRSRGEAALFPGFLVGLSPFLGFHRYFARKEGRTREGILFQLAAGVFLSLFLATFTYGNHSLWPLFRFLPGATALRCIGRVQLLLLIPLGLFAGLLVSEWQTRGGRLGQVLALFFSLGILVENLYLPTHLFDTRIAEQRTKELVRYLQESKADGPFYYAARNPGPITHLDAMWASMETGIPTINGYSSWSPPVWFRLGLENPASVSEGQLRSWLRTEGRSDAGKILRAPPTPGSGEMVFRMLGNRERRRPSDQGT